MCFLIKKSLMMTKNLNYMIYFLCQIKILQLKMLKLLKNPGFLIKFPGFSRFFSIFLKFHVFPGYFSLNCQIPGFSSFPGKVATLNNKKLFITIK